MRGVEWIVKDHTVKADHVEMFDDVVGTSDAHTGDNKLWCRQNLA